MLKRNKDIVSIKLIYQLYMYTSYTHLLAVLKTLKFVNAFTTVCTR